jgi:hypothetical protein
VAEAQCKFTQISSGRFFGQVNRVELGDLTMHHLYSRPESLNVSVTEGDVSVFVLPFRWSGDRLWDGRPLRRPPPLYYPSGTEHIRRGRAVEGLAFAVPSDWFASAVAALVGIEVNDVRLQRGEIAISPKARDALAQRTLETMAAINATPAAFHDHRVQEMTAARIRNMLVSIVASEPRVEREQRNRVDATRIVRSPRSTSTRPGTTSSHSPISAAPRG